MPKSLPVLDEKIARVLKVAQFGFLEAIDYAACVEILERGNQDAVHIALEASGAGLSATLVQKALFQRVLVGVMTAFDPIRDDGDFHLRVGMNLLSEPEVFDAVGARGRPEKLSEAISRFDALAGDPSLPVLRHYRNKEAVHLADFDPAIRRPLIGELLTFAHNTGSLAEALARGSGVIALSLASRMKAHADSAKSFWRPWKT